MTITLTSGGSLNPWETKRVMKLKNKQTNKVQVLVFYRGSNLFIVGGEKWRIFPASSQGWI